MISVKSSVASVLMVLVVAACGQSGVPADRPTSEEPSQARQAALPDQIEAVPEVIEAVDVSVLKEIAYEEQGILPSWISVERDVMIDAYQTGPTEYAERIFGLVSRGNIIAIVGENISLKIYEGTIQNGTIRASIVSYRRHRFDSTYVSVRVEGTTYGTLLAIPAVTCFPTSEGGSSGQALFRRGGDSRPTRYAQVLMKTKDAAVVCRFGDASVEESSGGMTGTEVENRTPERTGPSVVTSPAWGQQVLPEYPERALASGFNAIASVRVSCALQPNGSLTDCQVVSEDPIDMGFGSAALAAARRSRVTQGTVDGAAVGARVEFTTRFRPPVD